MMDDITSNLLQYRAKQTSSLLLLNSKTTTTTTTGGGFSSTSTSSAPTRRSSRPYGRKTQPDEGNEQPLKPIRIESVENINDVRELCEQEFDRTCLQDKSNDLPKFHYDEICLGKLLGSGSFAAVIEVRGFNLLLKRKETTTTQTTTTKKQSSMSLVGNKKNTKLKSSFVVNNAKCMSTVTIKTSNTTKTNTNTNTTFRDSERSTETEMTVATGGSTFRESDSTSITATSSSTPRQSDTTTSTFSTVSPTLNDVHVIVKNDGGVNPSSNITKFQDSLTFIDYDYDDDESDPDEGGDDTDTNDDGSGGGIGSSGNFDDNQFLIESREFIAKHCLRQQAPRYAVKRIKPDIWNGSDIEMRLEGIADMARETHFLGMIDHPNIVRLRGTSFSSKYVDTTTSSNNENSTPPTTTTSVPTEPPPPYFLIIDRLDETLTKRIQHWKHRKKKLKSITGRVFRDRHGKKRAKLGEDVIMAQFELASALCYLHSLRICHRDLKPENIGFDFRGNLKLFDLGLAKELHDDLIAAGDGTYHLTEACGTPRYMASEVACGKPYNEMCDVYSFALLCWQMISLKSPYGKIDYNHLVQKIWGPPHERPTINPKWPNWLKDDILLKGWSHNVQERPSMKDIEGILAEEVGKHKKEFNLASHLTTRKSTMVLEKLESMTTKYNPNNRSNDVTKQLNINVRNQKIVETGLQINEEDEFHVSNPYIEDDTLNGLRSDCFQKIVENGFHHGKEEGDDEFHVSNPYIEGDDLNGLVGSGSECFRAEI